MKSGFELNNEIAKRYGEWMIAQQYSPLTKRNYGQVVERYLDFLGEKCAANATHLDVRTYIAHLAEKGLTHRTAYSHLGVLRRLYDFLYLGGVVSYVAPRIVRLRPYKRNHPRVLSEFVVRRYLSAARTPREKAVVEFLYGTGSRVSEISTLRIENIDFDARTARVEGKGPKGRTVLITNRALNALRKYIGRRTFGFVFRPDERPQRCFVRKVGGSWIARWRDYCGPGDRYVQRFKYLGRVRKMSFEDASRVLEPSLKSAILARPKPETPLTKRAFENIVDKIGQRSGLPYARPHMFRHSFATHLINRGADLLAVQALLGHAFVQTTAFYARLSRPRLVKIFEKCHPARGETWRPEN